MKAEYAVSNINGTSFCNYYCQNLRAHNRAKLNRQLSFSIFQVSVCTHNLLCTWNHPISNCQSLEGQIIVVQAADLTLQLFLT